MPQNTHAYPQAQSPFFNRLPPEVRVDIYRHCGQQTLARMEATCRRVSDEIAPTSDMSSSIWGNQFSKHCDDPRMAHYAVNILREPMLPKMRCKAFIAEKQKHEARLVDALWATQNNWPSGAAANNYPEMGFWAA